MNNTYYVYSEAELLIAAQSSDVMVAAENTQNRGYSLKTCEIFALEERSQVLTNLGNSLPFSLSNFIVSFICTCLTLDSHFSTYCNAKNKTQTT